MSDTEAATILGDEIFNLVRRGAQHQSPDVVIAAMVCATATMCVATAIPGRERAVLDEAVRLMQREAAEMPPPVLH